MIVIIKKNGARNAHVAVVEAGAVVVRKRKKIMKIRHMDLQFSAKVDMMEMIYLAIYIHNFIAYLRFLQN